jgi:hypothetical protein
MDGRALADEFQEWRYEPIRLNRHPSQAVNLPNDNRYGNAGEETNEDWPRKEGSHNAEPQQTRGQTYASNTKGYQRSDRRTVNQRISW